jgi:hypothetical protein
LAEAVAIRRPALREVVGDPRHEQEEQRQRAKCAPPGRRPWQEQRGHAEFDKRQHDRTGRGPPNRHPKFFEGLPRTGAIDELGDTGDGEDAGEHEAG